MTHRTRLSVEALDDRCLPSFGAPTSFPVGPNPQDMVAGDFNNDGYLDLATANGGTATVSVLLGDGQGGFGAAMNSYVDTNLPSGYPTYNRLVVSDLDGNGNLGLVVATGYIGWEDYYSQLTFLGGNGDGTFQYGGGVNLDANYGSPALIAASDGEFVVLSDLGNAHVQEWVPMGSYSFSIGDGYRIGNPVNALAVGDLNGDGDPDVMAGGIALLHEGPGSGTFHSPTSDPYGGALSTGAVAIGDFTGDGIPDLIAADQTVDILVGHGDGTFDSPISYSANGSWHYGVAVADFNGDGKLDAVTSDGSTGTVSLLLGNGNGALTYAAAYSADASLSSVVVGDFNGDGRPDVAALNSHSNAVSVLLNDGGTWTPPPPSVRINDVTVTEGNTGTVAAAFTVTMSAASTQPITVAYATADGTATTGSDYQAASGTLTFAPGETSKTITVQIIGDRLAEPTETFAVNLSAATNATIAEGQGIGTILDDEPRISISDATVNEGNTGTRPITFTVSLSAAYDVPVTIVYATANSTAAVGSDYQAKSGTLTIPAGQTSGTITVQVSGDRVAEPNETFVVNLSGATNATIADSEGIGTILDDEPRISIGDVRKSEGKKNQTTLFTFTVTLSVAYDQPVTMSFRTTDGTARTSDSDYVARTGTITFLPGETTKTITITVNGDSKKEADEYFYLDLSGNSGNSLFTKNRGIGTILNDD